MTQKRMRSRQCICDNQKQCEGMSLAFQMLDDPRGGHVELPLATCNPQFEFLHRMNELRKAYFRHLVTDGRLDDAGDSEEQPPTQYVALHHFHPKLVRQFADACGGCKVCLPPTLHRSEARRLGWRPTEMDRVYNIKGKATNDFYFVPDYSEEKAYNDLKRLSKAERIPVDISISVYQNAIMAINARKSQILLNGDVKVKKQKQHTKQQETADSSSVYQNARKTIKAQTNRIAIDDYGKSKNEKQHMKQQDKREKEQEKESHAPKPGVQDCPTPEKAAQKAKPVPRSRVDSNLPAHFQVIGTPEGRPAQATQDSVLDLGNSNATQRGESRVRAALDASVETLNESYNIMSPGEAGRRYGSIKVADLGASDTTVLYHGSSNLYSSVVSLQVTDPALQASVNTFHASDLTVRASGGGQTTKQLNSSDATVQASNTCALEGSEKMLDSPEPGSFKTKSIQELHLQSSSAALDFALEILPKRKSESVPAPDILDELKSRKPKSPEKLELPALPNAGSIPNADLRFCCLPSTRANDVSPMTPRRLASRKTLHCEDSAHEEKIPCSAKMDQPESDAQDESVQSTSSSASQMSSPMSPEQEVNQDDHRNRLHSRRNDDTCVPLVGATDAAAAMSLRRASTSQLVLRDSKALGNRLHTRSVWEGKGSPPVRSWSGDSTFFRQRRVCYTPRRWKSESIETLRRRSDTVILARRGVASRMSISSGRPASKLGVSRRIDTTSRAMKQYCDSFSSDDSQLSGSQRVPRRFRSRRSRSRSDSPTRDVRRGRRGAVVASDGNELLDSAGTRRTRTTPRRTESADSIQFCKRSSDPSPVRSLKGEHRGVRRTKSTMSPDRSSRKSRIQQKEGSGKRGPSPLRSTLGRNRSMSPTGRHPNIRRLDTTKRAMKQFIHDTGTGSDVVSDPPQRRSPRRTKSRQSDRRSNTPTRYRSPIRETLGHNRISQSPMNSSSCPDAFGKDDEMNRVLLHRSLRDIGSSSTGVIAKPPTLQRAKTDSYPALNSHYRVSDSTSSHTDHAAGSYSAHHPALSPSSSDRPVLVNDSDAKSSSPGSDLSELIGEDHQDGSKPLATEFHHKEEAEGTRQPITKEGIEKNNIDIAETTVETQKVGTLSVSLHLKDIGCDKATNKGFHQSLTLTDTTVAKSVGMTAKMGFAGFNFSYPLPIKSERSKAVDWESIGFYSSGTSPQREKLAEDDGGRATFGLPLRLVGKKARQGMLAEVVLTAHRRQVMAAKKQGATRSPASKTVMKEILAAVKKTEEANIDFSVQVAKTAEALLEGDRAGHLRAASRKASMENSLGQGISILSLSVDGVFEESQDFSVLQAPDGLTSAPHKTGALDESVISLSLRRVFEGSDYNVSQAQNSSYSVPNSSNFDQRGGISSAQLRAVFPFKSLRERKQASSHLSSDDAQNESWKDPVLALPERRATQAPSEKLISPSIPPPMRETKEDLGDCMYMSSATSEWCIERLPEIAEEEFEVEMAPAELEKDHSEGALAHGGTPGEKPQPILLAGSEYTGSDSSALEPMTISTLTKLGVEQDVYLSHGGCDDSTMISSTGVISLGMRAKMASLLSEEISEHDPAASSAMLSPYKLNGTNAGHEVAKRTEIVEFHLSFPPALALASRGLPSLDSCFRLNQSLGPHLKDPRPAKGHSRPTTVNTLCEHEQADGKIDLSFQEILFVPDVLNWASLQRGSKGNKKMGDSGRSNEMNRRQRQECPIGGYN